MEVTVFTTLSALFKERTNLATFSLPLCSYKFEPPTDSVLFMMVSYKRVSGYFCSSYFFHWEHVPDGKKTVDDSSIFLELLCASELMRIFFKVKFCSEHSVCLIFSGDFLMLL